MSRASRPAEPPCALGATLETCAEAVDGVRADVHVVQSMLDRLAFMYLVHTPEVQKAQREAALLSGTRRHASWRRAVTQMARDVSFDGGLTRTGGNKRGV